MSKPHRNKNKARQRGCDLGTAGEKLWRGWGLVDEGDGSGTEGFGVGGGFIAV